MTARSRLVHQPAMSVLSPLPPGDDELVIRRSFAAPRPLVFRCWTEAEHARHWWGPANYPATSLVMDARVGGRWRAVLKSTEGKPDLSHGGVFHEVTAPERLVFTFTWDEDGERGMETIVTITLREIDGHTEMELRQSPFLSGGERDGHGGGWNSCFDRMAIHLAKP
ncbi:MAG TPA: SRPBCC domain-containing protein [Planctomycetota bacterium]|nr:SRPBCC domain-containing protein [Planctomycetota bacterium]